MLAALGICFSLASGYLAGLFTHSLDIGALPFLLLTVPIASMVFSWLPISIWLRTWAANFFGVGEVAGLMTGELLWIAHHGMGDKPTEVLIPVIVILIIVVFWINVISFTVHLWQGKDGRR